MERINFDQIKIFLEVAKTLSFTRASEKLYVTQPTVTKWIKYLETSLEIQLFERTSKHVELTEAGELLFTKWSKLYDDFEAGIREIKELEANKAQEIKIGILQYFNFESCLFDLGAKFESAFRDYSVSFSLYTINEIRSKASGMDLIFTTDIEAETMQGYEKIVLDKIDLYLVVSQNHPLAEKDIVYLKETQNETFFVFSSESSPTGLTHVKQAFEKQHVSPNFISIDNIPSQFLQIMKGKGVAITNDVYAQTCSEEVKQIPIADLDFTLHNVCLWRNKGLKTSAKCFLQFLKNSRGLI